MSTTPISPATCRNCGTPVRGRFCTVCGQEDRPIDPTVGEVVREFAGEISSLDGRIVRSVRRLFLSPGFLTMEHFSGRRVSWVSPVRLYLIFSVCYFALTSLIGSTPLDVDFRVTGDNDQDIRQQVEKLGFSSADEPQRLINQALTTWFPRAMFVLVPLFAWFVSLVRRRSGRHYPHHLIFACHVFAVWFGAQSIAVAAGYLVGSVIVKTVVGISSMIYAFGYLIRAFKTVYGGSLTRAAAHAVVVLVFYGVATVAIAATITAAAVLWR